MGATRVFQYGVSMPSRLTTLNEKLMGPITQQELLVCQQELCWLYRQCHTEWLIGILYGRRVKKLLLYATKRLDVLPA